MTTKRNTKRKRGTIKNRADNYGVIVVSYNFSEKCAQKIKNAQLKNEIEDESCRIRDATTDL
jgi:hypothetical protein